MNAIITVFAFESVKLWLQCPTVPQILFTFLYVLPYTFIQGQSTREDTVSLVCCQNIQKTILSENTDNIWNETYLLSAIYRIRAYSVQKYDPYAMLKILSTQLTKQNKFFEVYFRLNRENGNYANKSYVSPRPSVECLHILYTKSIGSFHSENIRLGHIIPFSQPYKAFGSMIHL